MIDPNATQIKAQAIEIHSTGSGWWNVYDASGHLHAQLLTRDDAVAVARVAFHVRDNEWRTIAVECPRCKGVDFECEKCGGHGTVPVRTIAA
jgi:hypothetical protein